MLSRLMLIKHYLTEKTTDGFLWGNVKGSPSTDERATRVLAAVSGFPREESNKRTITGQNEVIIFHFFFLLCLKGTIY